MFLITSSLLPSILNLKNLCENLTMIDNVECWMFDSGTRFDKVESLTMIDLEGDIYKSFVYLSWWYTSLHVKRIVQSVSLIYYLFSQV